jgi:hypothetical protein
MNNEELRPLLEQVNSKKGEYSEFLILSDTIKKIVRFYPTKKEFYLFNTEKSESLKFERFESERASIMEFNEIFDQYVYLMTGENE